MRSIGPYTTGEIPEPLTVTFTDVDGAPINLSGYEALWITRAGNSAPRSSAADVAADQAATPGEVTYTWVDGDLDEAGNCRAEMWVDNGVNRLCSELFSFHVRAAIETPSFAS